jgi:hypothetical protein
LKRKTSSFIWLKVFPLNRFFSKEQGFPDAEMVDAFGDLVLAEQRQGNAGAGRNPGDTVVETCFQQLLIEAQLDQLVVGRHDAVHAVQVGADALDFHMLQRKDARIEFHQVFAEHTFPQVAHFDHDDHLVLQTAFARLGVDGLDCADLGVEADVRAIQHFADAAPWNGLDVDGFDGRVDALDCRKVAEPGIEYGSRMQLEHLLQVGRMPTQDFGDHAPFLPVIFHPLVQMPKVVGEGCWLEF